MYSTIATDDSLRMRYRQSRPITRTQRRLVQPDVRVNRPSVPMPPAGSARADRRRPAVVPVEATSPPLALDLNLRDVPAAPLKRSRYLVKPRRAGQFALVFMALSLFGMGGYISLSGFKNNRAVAQTVNNLSSAAVADAPDTTKPSSDAYSSYTVAAGMPRYLRIDSLNTKARVMSLGTNSKGAVAAPSNVFDVAWFKQSALPGSKGAAFISGHVSSWTTDGVFYNLKNATTGTIIEVERGDGTILQYKVVKTTVFNADNVDMDMALTPVTPGKEGLNLMTCTGKVKSGTSEFDSRLLVMAERVS